MTEKPKLDEYGAMAVLLTAMDAFTSLDWERVPPLERRGVVLLLDAILHQTKPFLRETPEMQHVFNGMANIERVAAAIRHVVDLPPVV